MKRTNLLLLSVLIIIPFLSKAQQFVDGAGACGGNTPCHTTVQAAVTAATPGQTISVYPGTYDELVTINKALTLSSVSGKATTTLKYTGTGSYIAPLMIEGPANGITIGGALNKGFTIIGVDNPNDASGAGVEAAAIIIGSNAASTISNIDISHNTITCNGEGGIITYYKIPDLYNGVSVHDNLFNGKTYVSPPAAGGLFTHFNTPKYALGINPGTANFSFVNNTVITQSGENGVGRGSVYAEPAGSVFNHNTFTPFFAGTNRAILLIGGTAASITCNYFSMGGAGDARFYIKSVTSPVSFNTATVAAGNTFRNPGGVIVVDSIGINTFFTGTAANSTTGCSPILPLRKIDIGHKDKQGNRCVIFWKTTGELNIRSFTLEISDDGARFFPFATVASKGDGDNIYELPFINTGGPVVYIRVKETDWDNASFYSNVGKINFTVNPVADFTVSPNPASGMLRFTWNAPVTGCYLKITGSDGKMIYQHTIHGTSENINTSSWSSGLYFYTLFASGEQVAAGKLVKN